MLKSIIIFLIFISCLDVCAQTEPSGFPTQANTGWQQWGFQQSTKGTIIALRDTTFLPRYNGTMVFRPQNIRPYFYDSTVLRWFKLFSESDTLTILATKYDLTQIIAPNFANANLTFTGDRTHQLENFSLRIDKGADATLRIDPTNGAYQLGKATFNGAYLSMDTTSGITLLQAANADYIEMNAPSERLHVVMQSGFNFLDLDAGNGTYQIGDISSFGLGNNTYFKVDDANSQFSFNTEGARKALLASTGQWTWDGYPALTAQIDSATYKPVAIDASGNIVKMAGWAGGGGGALNWDAVLALGGRLTANRSFSMAQRMATFDSASIHIGNVDSVGLSFDLLKAGTMIKFNKPAGTARTYPGSTPFRFIMENTTDDVLEERNTPVKWGWNINRADSSLYPGIWYSMEPNYRPGGARFIENHLEISMPNGTIKNSRLFSSTYVLGDSIGNSTNAWFFSGTTWAFRNLVNTVDWVTMSNGRLGINNNTSNDTELLLTNGSDEGRFTLSPGTSVLDYTGVLFRMTGELNTAVQNMSSTGRAGIRFIGDGGITGYLIKYGSAWAAQDYLRNAMVFTAANGNPLQTSITLKNNGTSWIGDIEAYNSGDQKVNISGSLALRGNSVATTASYILGKRSDSTVVELTPASLATLLGVGGNTIYSGDGTVSGPRTVNSGGNTVTFRGTDNSDTIMAVINSGTSSTGIYSIGSLFGVDAQSSNIGLRAFGNATGIVTTGDASEGAVIKSNTIRGATIQSVPSSTNTVQEVVRLERGVNGSPGANGIGASLNYYLKRTDNTSSESNTIVSKFTDAVAATLTSQLYITGYNNGSSSTIATFDGNANATFGTTNSIVGTTTNNNAVAGNIGEEMNSTVSTYTNYTTTATYQNIASITLTAGDWDITAQGTFSSNGATITAASDAIFVISTTTASASGATEGKNISYVPQAALLGTSHESITIAPYRVSLSGSTTYYLNTQSTFTVGNPQFVGTIRARRIR